MLASIFFARFGQIFTSLVIKSGSEHALSLIFQLFSPLYFAAPACFYLYITGFIHNRHRLTKLELLHFLPALLAIIHVIPWPGSKILNWTLITAQLRDSGYLFLTAENGLFPAYFQSAGRPLLTVIYLILCWHAILKFKMKDDQVNHDDHGRSWIIFLLKVATFFQLAGLIPIVLKFLNIPLHHSFFIISNCIMLLVILMYALHRPHIFYGYLLVAIDWDTKEPPAEMPVSSQEKVTEPLLLMAIERPKVKTHRQKKLNLSPAQTANYALLIKEVMESEQMYLQPGLQIIDLATRVNIPVHHCSHVINNYIGKNFRDWINGYRVEYFLRQYPLQSDKITIEAIAHESGFKSQATFYNAFKKEKGVMPTVYFSQGTTGGAV
ncbi:helix-turn-helix domain-containing protein [Pedobacter petrophilus]|uniref:helix-turn-helix domain-containing protein n=1 Tax=Pedobacter petrophilus TaxID=1908241 RepID=UPI00142EEF61|nr:helix-turn-helix domain-containing protein [Pedobacter petrophilus]